ncbi:MAG TPA: deaminase [Pseudonocardiaceae bacterium]
MADAPLDDHAWLSVAVKLAARCVPSSTAFSVGAVIVDRAGRLLADGFSREGGPAYHAEESALGKLAPHDPLLAEATLYSSMEPCGRRSSRPSPCAQLIIEAGIRRVVYALGEPPTFVPASGAHKLRSAGVRVIDIPELAWGVRTANRHLGL